MNVVLALQTLDTPTESGRSTSPWILRTRSRTASEPPWGDPHDRPQRVLPAVEQRPRGGGSKSPLESVVGRLGDQHDVREVEVAAESRGPPLQISTRPSARELLEEVLDQVLLRELLDDLDLLDPHRDLARDRATELDARASLGDEQPDELAVRDERHREPAAAASASKLGAELGEAERRARGAGLGVACEALELLARRLEEIDVAGARGEQRTCALDDGLQQLVERTGARDRLGELGELLELCNPDSRLLVERRVLDRTGYERSGRHEKVDLVVGELAGRLGVGGDDAEHVAPTSDDRNGEKRLELLLLELREVLRPRIGQRVVADERGLAALSRPPREPFPALHDNLSSLPLVRRRRRSELEPLPVLREQVHEASVDAAALRHEPHDRAQDLGQLERRRNRRDDLVERSLACPQRHVKADRKLGALESPASAARLRRRGA